MTRLAAVCLMIIGITMAAFAQSSTSATRRVIAGTSLSATCQPTGSNIFFKSDTGILYVCTAANTWTAASIQGSSNGQLLYNNGGIIGGVTSSSVSGANLALEGNLTLGGTPDANTWIAVSKSSGATGTQYGIKTNVSNSGNYSSYGGSFTASGAGSGTTSAVYGVVGTATTSATNTEFIAGLNFNSVVASGTTSEAYGTFSTLSLNGGTISTAAGLQIQVSNSGGAVTSLYGLKLSMSQVAGSSTTSYGIYADTSIDIGSTRYFIYSTSTSPSYIEGGILTNRNVTAKTADYSVLAADTNRLFTNTGAGATVIFTLPTPVTGMTYEFYRNANQTVTLDVGGSVTIRVGSSVTTAGGNVTLDAVGTMIRIVAISATQWVGILSGTATFN